ncbi:nitrogen regulation protein NR(II) [Gemmatimonas sp.]|jgi:two-component system sensor histidine kinase PilS (NtrC family)|uniref:two-component system sensor histidine kinase NtrB n=1 Tax=Gemmatimonas sp. TaxID=1962908 RepID=UPI0031C6A500|nr:PAS domain S-box protein [Gemmatimonas sp.]
MLRWVWLARVVLACAILVAAVFVWNEAAPSDTLIATLAFAMAILATVGSAMHVEIERQRPLGLAFYVGQCALDLLLVTAVVHITGGWSSQFAALYILVIASGALLLPFRGGLIVAASASLLYTLDVLWLRPGAGAPFLGVGVQLAVFAVVAIGSGYVALRLRQAGSGREALAAQLVKVQLEAAEILRTIRSGIVTIDSQGRLLYANPAASELLGLDLRASTGRPLLPSLLGVSPQLADLLERSARDGVRTTRAEGIIRRNGEEFEIGVTTTVADGTRPDGSVTATAIFQDISDSKRIQALHIRAERLQAVAELSASLAHEIRNPLASIRSATEQLSRRRVVRAATDDDDEGILHGLVVREADRLSRLLADFLDFARTRVTRLDALDVGALSHTAAMLAAAHPDRGPDVQVQVDIAPDLPRLAGDEDLLHRAIFNLVLNAIQAVGADGHVFVQVDRRPPNGVDGSSVAVTGELIAISVTDDGPGIPLELKDRVFEPFVSGKVGGTGLGLPVVHRAVEAHRGVVLVDRLPKGTRFCIVMPVTPTVPPVSSFQLNPSGVSA